MPYWWIQYFFLDEMHLSIKIWFITATVLVFRSVSKSISWKIKFILTKGLQSIISVYINPEPNRRLNIHIYVEWSDPFTTSASWGFRENANLYSPLTVSAEQVFESLTSMNSYLSIMMIFMKDILSAFTLSSTDIWVYSISWWIGLVEEFWLNGGLLKKTYASLKYIEATIILHSDMLIY